MRKKRTDATKRRSKNFGIASTATKILRQHFGDRLPFPKDKHMQRRFFGAVAKWLGCKDTAELPPEDDL